jgi:hypothetical protein
MQELKTLNRKIKKVTFFMYNNLKVKVIIILSEVVLDFYIGRDKWLVLIFLVKILNSVKIFCLR